MSDKPTEKAVQLDTPITRGKTEITEIILRKPQSGALRGTRLQAIMDMDVGAMMTVIPRISTPTLDESLSEMFGSLSDQLSNLQDTATSAIGKVKNMAGGLLS